MANWKARAKLALDHGDRELLERQLQETSRCGSTIGADIRLTLESLGRQLAQDPDPSVEALATLEGHYRALAHGCETAPDSLRLLEGLLSIFLGETVIRLYGGRWVIYEGRLHTGSPIVVKLDRFGKHFDVSIITRELHQKHQLHGSREGRALAVCAENAARLVF